MTKQNKVLIVIDAQEDFTRGSLRNEEAIKALSKIHDAVVYANEHFYNPTIYTQDSHTAWYLNTQEGRNLPIYHCLKFRPGWQICEEAIPSHTMYYKSGSMYYTFRKSTFGCLDLINKAIIGSDDEIWLCGFCTDICVSANFQILKAAYPEIPIVIIEDACAGVTPELHEAALKVMKSCQAKVAKLDELIKEV